jgi:transaldolase
MTDVNMVLNSSTGMPVSPAGAVVTLDFLVQVAHSSEPGSLLERALTEGKQSMLQGEELIEEITDQMIVLAACDVLRGTTSMVTIQTGAHLSFDVNSTTTKIQKLVKKLEQHGFQRNRVMFELGCTWEAIRAAAVLQGDGIQCSLSSVLSFCQAAAAADAGASLILIPIQHMTEGQERDGAVSTLTASNPGVLLLWQIYGYLKFTGSKSRVGGTMLQSVDEVLAIAGCDSITVTPEIAEELRARPGPVVAQLDSNLKDPDVDVLSSFSMQGEPAFRRQLNANALATEKLAQGMRNSQRCLDELWRRVQQSLQ